MSILRLHDEMALQTLIDNYGINEVFDAFIELKAQYTKKELNHVDSNTLFVAPGATSLEKERETQATHYLGKALPKKCGKESCVCSESPFMSCGKNNKEIRL